MEHERMTTLAKCDPVHLSVSVLGQALCLQELTGRSVWEGPSSVDSPVEQCMKRYAEVPPLLTKDRQSTCNDSPLGHYNCFQAY